MEVKHLCIVGGGTSGWMLAVALERYNPNIKVTLIESPNVGTIGVGESTIPSVSRFINDYLGFKEEEWMPYCDAVYKASIRFNNFKRKGHTALHPFWSPEENNANGFNWAVKKAIDPTTTIKEYSDTFYSASHMTDNNTFSSHITYAHHIDATKFGQYCKSKCEKLNHVIGHITEVTTNDDGIDKLIFKDGKEITADLFVDCTGFRALLLGKTLREEFIPSSDYLLNDSAVTARVPYLEDSEKDEMLVYTDCTALSSGWVWNTPLWSRIGTGYVYSSEYLSNEEAEAEFREHLRERFGNRADQVEYGHLKFRAGRYKRVWVDNCASLVLSSGFVEPLESTGLALMVSQVKQLVSILDSCSYNSFDRETYNTTTANHVDEVVDFVSLHYSSTEREDTPYWKFVSNNIKIPNNLVNTINEIVTTQNPTGATFPIKSWESILIGFEVTSTSYFNKDEITYYDKPISSMNEEEKAYALNDVSSLLKETKDSKELEASEYLSHYDFLRYSLY